jgi:hypothetical protein
LQHDRRRGELYQLLQPAEGSRGVYGDQGTVQDFLAGQGAALHLRATKRYASLLESFRQRLAVLCDFDTVEPREFWRVAVREALAEANFDFNPLINALFDPDSLGVRDDRHADFVEQHVTAIEHLIGCATKAAPIAAAAVMLAVSLGYSPGEVMIG